MEELAQELKQLIDGFFYFTLFTCGPFVLYYWLEKEWIKLKANYKKWTS